MTQSFETLGLIPAIQATVAERGYTAPTPIQSEAIPHLLHGRDVMGQAQTGTGKTAAFTLPMVQQLQGAGLQTLILTPTRELAVQTADTVYQYGHKLGIRVLPVYGGTAYPRQIKRLQKGVQVVVGTPGRTLDLIKDVLSGLEETGSEPTGGSSSRSSSAAGSRAASMAMRAPRRSASSALRTGSLVVRT